MKIAIGLRLGVRNQIPKGTGANGRRSGLTFVLPVGVWLRLHPRMAREPAVGVGVDVG